MEEAWLPLADVDGDEMVVPVSKIYIWEAHNDLAQKTYHLALLTPDSQYRINKWNIDEVTFTALKNYLTGQVSFEETKEKTKAAKK